MTDDKKDITHRLLESLLNKAKTYGATDADAVLSASSSVSVKRRLGKPESVVRSEETEVGLRVLVGQRQAIVSSSDLRTETLFEMAERAVAMARLAPEDAFAGIADGADVARKFPELDLHDPSEPPIEDMIARADRAESAALAVKGITNSDGAEFSSGKEEIYYAASNGFFGGYPSSGFSLTVGVIAGKDTEMESDYDFDSATFLCDLKDPETLGRVAGERAAAALHPRKAPTKRMPVVFDRRVAGGLIGSLAGAISGNAVARGTTFLKEKMGQQIFADGVTVVDDPFLKRGVRSHPFDAEGLAPQKRHIIQAGVLSGWLLDLSSARQLKLKSTGNAARGASSVPSPKPANFYMQPGTKSPQEIIAEIEEGFFITHLLGSGANIVTGDVSRGAKGFLIEKGKITHPVSEMTIAGNLKDMWLNLAPANDLELKFGVDAPTLRVDGMMVAGA